MPKTTTYLLSKDVFDCEFKKLLSTILVQLPATVSRVSVCLMSAVCYACICGVDLFLLSSPCAQLRKRKPSPTAHGGSLEGSRVVHFAGSYGFLTCSSYLSIYMLFIYLLIYTYISIKAIHQRYGGCPQRNARLLKVLFPQESYVIHPLSRNWP